MTTKWDELKRVAQKATPGPWMAASDWSRYAVMQAASPYKRVVCTGNQNNAERWANEPWSGCDSWDADFIAAANPGAVLELIAEIEQLTQRFHETLEKHRTTFTQLEGAQRECERLRHLLGRLHPHVRGCSSELWSEYQREISAKEGAK